LGCVQHLDGIPEPPQTLTQHLVGIPISWWGLQRVS